MIQAATPGRWRRFRRGVAHPSLCGATALGLVFSASWSDPMLAVGLGQVTQQSAFGQSLRVVVPILVGPGEDPAAECFRLAASEREVDGVPQLAFGRLSVERSAAGAQLVITNARPVNDPALRVTIQTGCDTSIRREYVLLMDPPPIEAPLIAAEAEPRVAAAQAPAPPPAAVPPRRTRAAGRPATTTPTHVAAESTAAPRKPSAKTRAPAQASKPAARVATNQPRLTVSSAAPTGAGVQRTASASEADQARAQQELANAIEAETVVLRQRIVELTAMVERMQQEVRANELAQRATDAAAKAAPPVVATGWWADQNWPLLSTIFGLPVLLAGSLLWRRRQQRDADEPWLADSAATVAANDPATRMRSAAPALQNAAAGMSAAASQGAPVAASRVAPVAASQLEPAHRRSSLSARAARDGASALAVSELLHVTEEARVYVALGRPERAIAVLNDHIRDVPRSMPAAWLMLLELYHASGRQQDFRRLAEEFHLHCNVKAPPWEDFTPSESAEGGLETFPHILRQVASNWRQPGCREYLEALLYDNREGRRIGFPLAAYGEILLLLQVLDAPPAVDIDSDLVNDGKLEPIPKPVLTGVREPQADPPRAQAPRPRTARVQTLQRPSQQPLALEPDLDEAARARAKNA